MYGFVCRSRLQSLLLASHNVTILTNTNPQLGFLHNCFFFALRSLSTSLNTNKLANDDENRQKDCLFTLSYLINSCGLSPHSAKAASKSIVLQNSKNPNAVISLFKDYGLTNAHISKIVAREPRLLLADPKDTILPKLEFFRSLGASSSDLGMILTRDTRLLLQSLEGCVIPCYNILKRILSDQEVVRYMKHFYWFNMQYFSQNLDFNLLLLEQLGVPRSVISHLVVFRPDVVACKANRLSESAKKAIEIGCDPSKCSFAHELHVMCHMNTQTWDSKMEFFRRLGLSENEVLTAFKKNPHFMSLSEKRIMKAMDFFVNKMGYTPAAVVSVPTILCYSFERRIVPRCSVLRILLLKGLFKREISLSTVLRKTEEDFLNMFVMKYQKEVPQLLSILRRKMSIAELGFGFEDRTKNWK